MRRIITAVLINIDGWRIRALMIADSLPTGAQYDALHLAKDIEMARLSLCRLARMEGCENDAGTD
jgi:hypothetical protein